MQRYDVASMLIRYFILFFIFPWKKKTLIFYVNCLLWRHFAWKVKACFLGKMKKCHYFAVYSESGKILNTWANFATVFDNFVIVTQISLCRVCVEFSIPVHPIVACRSEEEVVFAALFYWNENKIEVKSGNEIYIFLQKKIAKLDLQSVDTLIRRHILRHLIWLCTVCLLPFLGLQTKTGIYTDESWLKHT